MTVDKEVAKVQHKIFSSLLNALTLQNVYPCLGFAIFAVKVFWRQ